MSTCYAISEFLFLLSQSVNSQEAFTVYLFIPVFVSASFSAFANISYMLLWACSNDPAQQAGQMNGICSVQIKHAYLDNIIIIVVMIRNFENGYMDKYNAYKN